MHGRYQTKTRKPIWIRYGVAAVLVLVLSISSFATVMANTVSANVIDGTQSYSFSMSSTKLEDILAEAEKQGLTPLGTLDVAERVENTTTVNIRRGVAMLVDIAGEQSQLTAYKGDTIEQALSDHSIVLKEKDEILPPRETVITGNFSVEIKRFCTVNVTAGGKTTQVSMTGGTVADALSQAGVTPGTEDKVNYEKDEPLFDKMNIRVVSPAQVEILADGKSTKLSASTETVEELVKKAKITLGKEDRLNVDAKAHVKDGMVIQVQRVKTETLKETQEVDYPSVIESTGDLFVDETSVKTTGVKGTKEVTYEVVTVDGVQESKNVLSEKVTKEPVKEVILQGTKERPVEETPSNPSSPGGNFNGGDYTGGGSTFVDYQGNVVSYSSMLSGDCTAYSVPGGTTSLGWDAVYGVIAVNPNVIPYGTKLYVASPDGSVVYGYGVAGDTGGALMDGTVIADLCYNTIEECSIIGRRTMNVYILG